MLYGFPKLSFMKIKPPHLKSLFLVVFIFSLFKASVAQDSSSVKTPMYYNLDSSTDSISAIGERPATVNPNSVKVFVDKSFPIAGYIIIAIIVGAVFAVAFSSLGKKKEIEFKKWNLENREKLKNYKK
jgi:hypothetical protein